MQKMQQLLETMQKAREVQDWSTRPVAVPAWLFHWDSAQCYIEFQFLGRKRNNSHVHLCIQAYHIFAQSLHGMKYMYRYVGLQLYERASARHTSYHAPAHSAISKAAWSMLRSWLSRCFIASCRYLHICLMGRESRWREKVYLPFSPFICTFCTFCHFLDWRLKKC